jgi:hypothetical protein
MRAQLGAIGRNCMTTVPACPLLVPSLLARMGADRTARLEALAGPEGALAAIRANIRRSVLTWCGVDAGGVVNMGGVLPGGEGWGYVWQFITDAVREHKRAYLTQAKDMMRRAKAILPRTTIPSSKPT